MLLSRSRRFALATLLAAAPFAACDDGAAPATEPTPSEPTPSEPTEPEPTEPTPTEPDGPVEPDGPAEPEAAPYPEGPYGTGYLDVTRDLSFYDPWNGVDYKLSDYYQDPDTRVVVISSAAGWCTACQYEAWDLVEIYSEYADYGLEVLYTLYEDNKGKPLWQEGAGFDAWDRDLTFLTLWKQSLGVSIDLPVREANYPVLVDREFIMEDYYNQGATPLTLIVRTRDMRILYRQVGYDPGSLEAIVKSVLFQP